jgi:hypothetical protein
MTEFKGSSFYPICLCQCVMVGCGVRVYFRISWPIFKTVLRYIIKAKTHNEAEDWQFKIIGAMKKKKQKNDDEAVAAARKMNLNFTIEHQEFQVGMR